MTPAPEKAAPIPADVRAIADASAATWRLLSYPSKVVLSDDIARAILADREARPSQLRSALRSLEKAATEVSRLGAVTGPQWGRLSAAIVRARACQGGNNG